MEFVNAFKATEAVVPFVFKFGICAIATGALLALARKADEHELGRAAVVMASICGGALVMGLR